MLKKFTNKKGFTLMEMLIVVAIIAVLVAIAIPTFTGQLEKSRQATDVANIRATYSECMVEYMQSDKLTADVVKTVKTVGKNEDATLKVAGVAVGTWDRGNTVSVTVNKDTGAVSYKVTTG